MRNCIIYFQNIGINIDTLLLEKCMNIIKQHQMTKKGRTSHHGEYFAPLKRDNGDEGIEF